MKAYASHDVPRAITEAIDDAVYEAQLEGLTPVSVYLGPAKWRAFFQWINSQTVFVKSHATLPGIIETYRYNGLPIERGAVHGIVVDCKPLFPHGT